MNEFEELYGKYMKLVYNFIMKLSGNSHIAEEITQQTFVIALEKLDSFRGECKMSVWLCQIAKHEYYAWEKKAKRQINHIEGQMGQVENPAKAGSDEMVNAMIDHEDYERIMEAWHKLPGVDIIYWGRYIMKRDDRTVIIDTICKMSIWMKVGFVIFAVAGAAVVGFYTLL